MDKTKLEGVGFPQGLAFSNKGNKKPQTGGAKPIKIINRSIRIVNLNLLKKSKQINFLQITIKNI